jgi:hypothetical protein
LKAFTGQYQQATILFGLSVSLKIRRRHDRRFYLPLSQAAKEAFGGLAAGILATMDLRVAGIRREIQAGI